MTAHPPAGEFALPPAFHVEYDHGLTGALTRVRENGATTGQGVLATYTYDDLGRRTITRRGNTVRTDYGYDGAGRLTTLAQNLAGTADDLTLGFTYNPAGRIVTRTMSNTAYAYTPGTGLYNFVNNGKNQLTSVGGAAVGYDARLNITSRPGASYGYNALNQLTSANPGTAATLTYDPAGRLQQTAGSTTTRYQYDGVQLIAEYNSAGALLRRHVPGLGLDDVIVTVEGTDRRWLVGDEGGSVIALTNSSAALAGRNTYDEYGQPGSANAGRFQYTGQVWLPEARVYHYRARAYAPALGRFLQTDPIGYAAGPNLYAYVGADPVNWADPSGLIPCDDDPTVECIDGVTVTGKRPIHMPTFYLRHGGVGPSGGVSGGGSGGSDEAERRRQQEECADAAFKGFLDSAKFRRWMARAMHLAQNTPNRGYGRMVPEHGSEHGFFAGYYGSYLARGLIFTNRRELNMTPEFVFELPFSQRQIFFHTHQSPARDATGMLSTWDLRWSNGNGVPVVSLNEDGALYCYAPY